MARIHSPRLTQSVHAMADQAVSAHTMKPPAPPIICLMSSHPSPQHPQHPSTCAAIGTLLADLRCVAVLDVRLVPDVDGAVRLVACRAAGSAQWGGTDGRRGRGGTAARCGGQVGEGRGAGSWCHGRARSQASLVLLEPLTRAENECPGGVASGSDTSVRAGLQQRIGLPIEWRRHALNRTQSQVSAAAAVPTQLREERVGELDGRPALRVEQLGADLREAGQPVAAVGGVHQVQEDLQRHHQHAVGRRICSPAPRRLPRRHPKVRVISAVALLQRILSASGRVSSHYRKAIWAFHKLAACREGGAGGGNHGWHLPGTRTYTCRGTSPR